MRTNLLLTKALIVVALLLGGVSSLWAADTFLSTMTGQVGTSTNDGNFKYATKKVKIAAGETIVYTITNYNKGNADNPWENWVVEGNLGSKYFDCEARGNQWQSGSGPVPVYTSVIATSDVADWVTKYNGAYVTITITRNTAGTEYTITHTSNVLGTTAGNTDKYYGGTWTVTVGAEEEWDIYLTEEYSHFDVKKVEYTDASGTKETEVLMNCASSITMIGTSEYGTDGSAYSNLILLNSYAAQGGAGAFSFILDEDWDASKVKSAVLKFYPISKPNKNRSGNIFIRELDAFPTPSTTSTSYSDGNHIVYSYGGSNTKRYAFTTNTLATISASAYTNSDPAQGSYYDVDLSLYIKGLSSKSAGDKLYFGIDISDFAFDTRIGAYGNDYAPLLCITYSSMDYFTVTFTNTTSGNTPSVTIYTDNERNNTIENGLLENGKTYYFTAVETGYQDYNGEFTVNGSDPAINFSMTAKALYNYTVNAVDGNNQNLMTNIASGTCYAGESTTFSLPACVLVDGKLYFINEFSKTETVNSDNQVFSYAYTTNTVDNVSYFFEGENLNVMGSAYPGGGAATSKSNGNDRRAGSNSNLYTPALARGIYTVYMRVFGNNAKAATSPIYYCNTDGTSPVSLNLTTPATTANAFSTISIENVPLPGEKSLCFFNGNSGANNNSNFTIDYIYLIKTADLPETVSATLGANGYTTFASPYCLDLSNLPEGLKAYTATLDGKNLSFQLCEQAVAAGTGLLLQGTGGETYNIPVVASGTAITDNALTGVTAVTPLKSDETNYIFAMKKANSATDELLFAPLTSANNVNFPAGKAYITVPASAFATPNTARALVLTFDDATSVKELKNSGIEELKAYYNLQGQRVASPKKGLYIVNGRKVQVK